MVGRAVCFNGPVVTRLAPIAAVLVGSVACATAAPPRHVMERDLGQYAFRRYQKVLDVEFRIEGNPGVGHTATYVFRPGDAISFATAFVTVYEKPTALAAEVRDRVRALGTYETEVVKRDGEWVWQLDGGHDRWLLWVSGNRVVKLGGPPGRDVPEDLYEAYLDVYGSDLDEHGRARPGAPSAGASKKQEQEKKEAEIPRHLREGAPR